jgi:hypothetical protein
MHRGCTTHGKDEKCIHNFSRKTGREEPNFENWTYDVDGGEGLIYTYLKELR